MKSHPLCTAREAKGFTMRDLALLLEMGKHGHRRVYGWEHGETIPTFLYAKALAQALGFESGQVVRQACLQWREQQSAASSQHESAATNEAEHAY